MAARTSILILGAGTQAKVVADLILALGTYDIAGFLEIGKDASRVGKNILGKPVLGAVGEVAAIAKKHNVTHAAVAIGDNRERARLIELARAAGLKLPPLVHPSAVICTGAQLGDGSVVAAHAMVGVEARLGEGAIINTSSSVDHDNVLGRCVHIAVGCHLAGTVTVGDYVTFGAGACAIPGVKVGNDVTVGAGAAVVSDLPNGCTALGVPAKPK
ncbi:MAG: acetyltransferase [Planctomycetes bacterium]|nr:acetyltransferase [Planctomycetota bacterium]NUQ34968.1 acetyltransferase [Planctomycetaceae bacterium]